MRSNPPLKQQDYEKALRRIKLAVLEAKITWLKRSKNNGR